MGTTAVVAVSFIEQLAGLRCAPASPALCHRRCAIGVMMRGAYLSFDFRAGMLHAR